MPMWSDMDRAFQGSGLTVKVGVSNWKSYGHGTPGPVEAVACHHTAGPPTGDRSAHHRPWPSGSTWLARHTSNGPRAVRSSASA